MIEFQSDVLIVGLTGQTGAGKSTVCKVFIEKGFVVINADAIARLVVEKGKPCLEEISDCFGSEVISSQGTLDRAVLASLVFSDNNKLEMLNSITHPYITAEILSQINEYTKKGEKLILLDAPTLFESRASDFCELIISVIAHDNIREKRIVERDNITLEQARKRMSSQHSEDFFRTNSDYFIKNNKSFENVYAVTKEVTDKIINYYNNKNNQN